MNPANATDARFIKLGGKGRWEMECIEATPGTIRLGFNNPLHEACLDGEWDKLTKYMRVERKKTKGKATEITNLVRDFYTLDESTIWITFYQRQLYWCFAAPEVVMLEDGSRVRETIGGWRNRSIGGKRLFVETLNGALTKTQGYRGTICSVRAFEYLKLRLSDEVLPKVKFAEERIRELETALVPLIRGLNWKDFELLCDLIFANAGWQRIASLGGTEKSIDLDLMSPVTGRRLFVQVKSQAKDSPRDTPTPFFMDRRLLSFDANDRFDNPASKYSCVFWRVVCPYAILKLQ
jgi:hypothetical protein